MQLHWSHSWRAAIIAVVLSAGAAGAAVAADAEKRNFAADSGASSVEVGAYPAEVQQAYRVFASRCSKCHSLARPINTDMTAGGWKLYVKRMMNKPDSGISPAQGKKIYSFLKYYQGVKDVRAKK